MAGDIWAHVDIKHLLQGLSIHQFCILLLIVPYLPIFPTKSRSRRTRGSESHLEGQIAAAVVEGTMGSGLPARRREEPE